MPIDLVLDGRTIGRVGSAAPFSYRAAMRRLSSVISFLLSLAAVDFAVACVVHLVTMDTIALHRLADETI